MSLAHDDPVYTLEDLLALPDDGRRYELLWGSIVMSPAPGAPHARIVWRLGLALEAACPAELEILPGSGVVIPGDPVVNAPGPDLTVVRRGAPEDPYPQSPDVVLVVEVSLSTLHRDTTSKADAYASGGIPWYWLVRRDGSITVHRLAGEGYEVVAVARPGTRSLLPGPFEVELDPAALTSR